MPLLPRDNQKFTASLRKEIGPVILQPRKIPFSGFNPCANLGTLHWISDFANHDFIVIHGYTFRGRRWLA